MVFLHFTVKPFQLFLFYQILTSTSVAIVNLQAFHYRPNKIWVCRCSIIQYQFLLCLKKNKRKSIYLIYLISFVIYYFNYYYYYYFFSYLCVSIILYYYFSKQEKPNTREESEIYIVKVTISAEMYIFQSTWCSRCFLVCWATSSIAWMLASQLVDLGRNINLFFIHGWNFRLKFLLFFSSSFSYLLLHFFNSFSFLLWFIFFLCSLFFIHICFFKQIFRIYSLM